MGVHGGHFLPIHRRRTVFGDEVHEAGDADVRFGGGAKQRDERLLLHRRVNAGAQFVLTQAALIEELFEQRIIGLGDEFDQLFVELADFVRPSGGRWRFLKFAAEVLLISDDLAAHDIQDGIETRARVDRPVHRENALAEMFAALRQHFLEVRLLLVHGIDHNHLRDAVLRGVAPDLVGSHAHAVVGVDHDQCEIAHPQRAQALADKIEVTGSVNDVEFLPQPLRVQQGGVDGNLALLLADVVIGDGRTLGDAAHSVDDATAYEHSLAQHRFAGRRVADDGEVSNVTGLECLHWPS